MDTCLTVNNISGPDTAFSALRDWSNALQVNALATILHAGADLFEQGWRFPCSDPEVESDAAGVRFLSSVFFVENIKQKICGGKEGKNEVRIRKGCLSLNTR